MTSAPNHHRLLNGNSILLSTLFIILFLLPACKTQKGAGDDITDTSIDKVQEDTVIVLTPTADSLLVEMDSFRVKDKYNIAYILPFYLDSLAQDSLNENPDFFYSNAEMATKFYLGSKLALDSLEKLGLNAKIHVFDSENNLGKIVSLKKSGTLDSMDIIIGPVYNGNVRYLANWAKLNEKILVNPLSPTAGLSEDNPWFIQINPSITTHIENLFELVKDQFSKENLIVINRPIKNELAYRNLWDQLSNTHNSWADSILKAVEFPKVPVDSINFKHFSISEVNEELIKENQLLEDTSLVKILNDSVTNVLIINSLDRTFINRLNRNIYKLADEYNVLVVGLPVWSTLEDFRMDYLEKFNLHYSSDYNIDSSFYSSDFYQTSLDSFHMHTNPFYIKGFDISMWLGLGLMQYGLDLNTELIDMELEGIHNNFKLGYTYEMKNDSSKTLNYLENKYVHLLNISDYTIVDLRKNKSIK